MRACVSICVCVCVRPSVCACVRTCVRVLCGGTPEWRRVREEVKARRTDKTATASTEMRWRRERKKGPARCTRRPWRKQSRCFFSFTHEQTAKTSALSITLIVYSTSFGLFILWTDNFFCGEPSQTFRSSLKNTQDRKTLPPYIRAFHLGGRLRREMDICHNFKLIILIIKYFSINKSISKRLWKITTRTFRHWHPSIFRFPPTTITTPFVRRSTNLPLDGANATFAH